MTKQLLIDTVSSVRLRMEESANGGKIVARGQFAIADKKTANNRIYPRGLWERELRRLQQAIEGRKVFGEADHPADGRTKLTRAAHIITNLTLQPDGQIVGEAQIMNTATGRDLKAILEAGGALGVSSRGYGSVKMNESGDDVVQDDFQLDTFDFVVDPAQPTAYPSFTQEAAPVSKPKTESNDEFVSTTSHRGCKIEVRKRLTAEGKTMFRGVTNAGSSLPVDFGEHPSIEEAVSAVTQSIDLMLPMTAESKEAPVDPKKEDAAPVDGEEEPKVEGDEPVVVPAADDEPKVDPAAEAPKVECGGDMAQIDELKARITELEGQLAAQTAVESTLKETNATLSEQCRGYESAVRELGFAVWLDRECGSFVEAVPVRKALGKLSRFESLDAMKLAATKLVDEAKAKVANRDAATVGMRDALTVENRQLKEQTTRVLERNKELKAENDELTKEVREALLAVWLEKRLSGSPLISEARVRFMRAEKKDKTLVEDIVKDLAKKPLLDEQVTLKTVRSRFKGAGAELPEGLVEGSVRSSQPAPAPGAAKIVLGEGLEINLDDFRVMSGIKKTQNG